VVRVSDTIYICIYIIISPSDYTVQTLELKLKSQSLDNIFLCGITNQIICDHNLADNIQIYIYIIIIRRFRVQGKDNSIYLKLAAETWEEMRPVFQVSPAFKAQFYNRMEIDEVRSSRVLFQSICLQVNKKDWHNKDSTLLKRLRSDAILV